MQDWQPLGAHRFRVVEDTLHATLCGECRPEHILPILRTVAEMQARNGYAIVIADVSAGITFPAETRRAVTDWGRSHKTTELSVIVGASVVSRTLITLMGSTVRLLGKEAPAYLFAPDWDAAAAAVADWRRRRHTG